jgi:hypothetical protein
VKVTSSNPHLIRVMNTAIAVRTLSFGAVGYARPAERERRLVRDFY